MSHLISELIDFNLAKAVSEAHEFYQGFCKDHEISERGILCRQSPKWAQQMVRRQGMVAAIMDKIGSNAFVKRRPEDKTNFTSYIEACVAQQKAIQFRIPIGPVKNMNLCGDTQYPDIAEYLMFIQLARFAAAVSAIYPCGVKIQLVPDDVRAKAANHCPENYVRSYVDGMRALLESMGFQGWLQVESGQMRLCDMYKVSLYAKEAENGLLQLKADGNENFLQRWEAALENARKNFVVKDVANAEQEVAASAWRYLVAHQSEILSGMWSPGDAFPMVYANHPNNYQLFSMGAKRTKLPWQIMLPWSLLEGDAQGRAVRMLYAPPAGIISATLSAHGR